MEENLIVNKGTQLKWISVEDQPLVIDAIIECPETGEDIDGYIVTENGSNVFVGAGLYSSGSWGISVNQIDADEHLSVLAITSGGYTGSTYDFDEFSHWLKFPKSMDEGTWYDPKMLLDDSYLNVLHSSVYTHPLTPEADVSFLAAKKQVNKDGTVEWWIEHCILSADNEELLVMEDGVYDNETAIYQVKDIDGFMPFPKFPKQKSK